jgi:predicted ABC-type ATPase
MAETRQDKPTVLVIGGPNGAGKTTISRTVLADALSLIEFVNADVIAQGLSGFNPERAAFAAGRVMLARLRELADARQSFAFESTLASRMFAPWFQSLIDQGWDVNLLYVWLRSPALAVSRVRTRVRKGGHFVPPDVVRRRYFRSAFNLIHLYMPVVTAWSVFDNSDHKGARIVAERRAGRSEPIIDDTETYEKLLGIADHEPEDDKAS